ncbi:relaxase/mobilization nuclease domain-containing protein [Flagellimonas sp. CMM7]|uniref:relaxase/mobilization nuclease domain-containing protein n=1 Tax=Flagellimonas sp. CMM7 TaxID=2654676 RepID=UPI0013D024D2|nr:relaxase/mobilization nuclease domain-containing protein [Flagellimonas sp. CMM7]UII79893.1 relaxase/mobilization nuclease domain-containing protein [Flagellimonas sp. CMM7]
MIGMGNSISHTSASMAYGLREEKRPEIVHSQFLAGDTPKEISQEFRTIQQQNHQCKKNTLSFVLSPTIKDGQEMKNRELQEITKRFLKQIKLQENQAIAFVHRNRKHVHIHLYVNRINFQGQAYKDSFIGKRSQQAAERVAKEMGLTTVRDVQQQKLDKAKDMRMILKRIHEKVISEIRPKDFDQYIKAMEAHPVKVIPSINKQNQLQGFRFELAGQNLKGSEVHRSMSMNRIAEEISFNKNVLEKAKTENTLKLLGKAVNISPNLAARITAKVVKHTIKKSIDLGMGI